MPDLTSLLAFSIGITLTMSFVGVTLWKNWCHRRRPVLRTALAITINWLIGVVYVQLTEDYTPWHFSIVIDSIAAYVVMHRPASKPQGYIGLFYIIQIACHIAYGVRQSGVIGEPGESTVYYDTITWIAWAQLMSIGAWCGGIWYDAILRRARIRSYEKASRQGFGHTRGEP